MPEENEDKPKETKKKSEPKQLKASKTWHKSSKLEQAPARAEVKVKAMVGDSKPTELKDSCYIRNGKVFHKASDITANVREFLIVKED